MASNIPTPTIQELDECLDKLVNWERFAIHLPGIEFEDTEKIMKDIHDVNKQKLALYSTWIDRHPDHSWNDVIKALKTVKLNSIAKQIQDKYSLSPIISSQYEYKVSEKIVDDLVKLHETFVPLAMNIRKEIQKEVVNGKVSAQTLASYVHEHSVGPRSRDLPITSVTSIEQILESVQPYTFLSPNLILNLATFFLVLHPVAKKADEYKSRIAAFKKSVKVRSLKNELGRFNEKFRNSSSHILLKILVTNAWGEQSIRLVEILLLTLFPIVHPDNLPWYSVLAGSLVLSFIATNHMMLPLIVSCARKIELMRHLGIISVTIGNVLIRVNKNGPQAPHDDDLFTFEDCLIQAILDDDIETVEFLLMYTKIDVNVKKHKYCTMFQNSQKFESRYATEADVLERLVNSKFILTSTWSKICEKEPSPPYTTIMNMIIGNQFLNTAALRNQATHLPDSIRNLLTSYCNSIEKNIKSVAKVRYIQKFLQSDPPSNYTTHVNVTLHRAWSECSVKCIEVVISFLFPLMPTEEFYWARVKEDMNTLRIELLMTKNLAESFQFTDQSHFSAKTLGVIEIQINDITIFRNMENKENYAFEKGIQQAKGTRIAEFLDYVMEIPCHQIANLNPYLSDDNNNIQTIPEDDATPLMIACCTSNGQIVKLLLDHGADPNIKTIELNTALFYCANSTIFEILLDYGADAEVFNKQNSTVLHRACRLETTNPRILKILLKNKYPHINSKGISENTALYEACARGNIDMVIGLLQANADPNIPNDAGITPILLASSNGYLPIVERLIEAKANPNIANKLGQTPLWMATSKGYVAVVKCLLEAKANPNIPDNDSNRTPLWIASSDGNEGVVKCLLEAKANPSIPDNDGITPLRIAHLQNHFHIASIILYHIYTSKLYD